MLNKAREIHRTFTSVLIPEIHVIRRLSKPISIDRVLANYTNYYTEIAFDIIIARSE